MNWMGTSKNRIQKRKATAANMQRQFFVKRKMENIGGHEQKSDIGNDLQNMSESGNYNLFDLHRVPSARTSRTNAGEVPNSSERGNVPYSGYAPSQPYLTEQDVGKKVLFIPNGKTSARAPLSRNIDPCKEYRQEPLLYQQNRGRYGNGETMNLPERYDDGLTGHRSDSPEQDAFENVFIDPDLQQPCQDRRSRSPSRWISGGLSCKAHTELITENFPNSFGTCCKHATESLRHRIDELQNAVRTQQLEIQRLTTLTRQFQIDAESIHPVTATPSSDLVSHRRNESFDSNKRMFEKTEISSSKGMPGHLLLGRHNLNMLEDFQESNQIVENSFGRHREVPPSQITINICTGPVACNADFRNALPSRRRQPLAPFGGYDQATKSASPTGPTSSLIDAGIVWAQDAVRTRGYQCGLSSSLIQLKEGRDLNTGQRQQIMHGSPRIEEVD
uniref:Uncharacterized protein n=1 Tax=Spongospora subterranea TaxID=70186 RepID=A0A0H5QIY4_9EUKA|eukprot:CRZ01958.1 hypothetical protein [Spongospora subterranea]